MTTAAKEISLEEKVHHVLYDGHQFEGVTVDQLLMIETCRKLNAINNKLGFWMFLTVLGIGVYLLFACSGLL